MNKARTEILQFVIDAFAEVSLGRLSLEEIHEGDSILGDLEFDSLDYATVMLQTEDFVGIRVSDKVVDWREYDTVGKLVDLLHVKQTAT